MAGEVRGRVTWWNAGTNAVSSHAIASIWQQTVKHVCIFQERLISDGERVLLAAESLRVCLRCKEGRRRKGRGRGAHYLRSRRTQKVRHSM